MNSLQSYEEGNLGGPALSYILRVLLETTLYYFDECNIDDNIILLKYLGRVLYNNL